MLALVFILLMFAVFTNKENKKRLQKGMTMLFLSSCCLLVTVFTFPEAKEEFRQLLSGDPKPIEFEDNIETIELDEIDTID